MKDLRTVGARVSPIACAVVLPLLIIGCGGGRGVRLTIPAAPPAHPSPSTLAPAAEPRRETPAQTTQSAQTPATPETPRAPEAERTPAVPLRFRVMTYNVGLLKIVNPLAAHDPKAAKGAGDVVPLVDERAALTPTLLSKRATEQKLDVIGLQEVWSKADSERISAALTQAGYMVYVPEFRLPEASVLKAFFDLLNQSKSENMSEDISKLASLPMPKVSILSPGLLLALSPRLKLKKAEFHAFREKGGFEVFTEKGFISAELEQTGMARPLRFDLYLTHFQAMFTSTGGQAYIPSEYNAHSAQQDQVHALVKQRAERSGLPALMIGDMNSGPGYIDKFFGRFASEFDYKAVSGQSITWDQNNPLVKHGEKSGDHSAVIDHVFLIGKGWKSEDAKITMAESNVPHASPDKFPALVPLSDHYAVEASLVLAPPADSSRGAP